MKPSLTSSLGSVATFSSSPLGSRPCRSNQTHWSLYSVAKMALARPPRTRARLSTRGIKRSLIQALRVRYMRLKRSYHRPCWLRLRSRTWCMSLPASSKTTKTCARCSQGRPSLVTRAARVSHRTLTRRRTWAAVSSFSKIK